MEKSIGVDLMRKRLEIRNINKIECSINFSEIDIETIHPRLGIEDQVHLPEGFHPMEEDG